MGLPFLENQFRGVFIKTLVHRETFFLQQILNLDVDNQHNEQSIWGSFIIVIFFWAWSLTLLQGDMMFLCMFMRRHVHSEHVFGESVNPYFWIMDYEVYNPRCPESDLHFQSLLLANIMLPGQSQLNKKKP